MKSSKNLFSSINERYLKRDLGEMLAQIVDFLDIAIWELDRASKIITCNHKALEIYGEDLVGRHCHSVTLNRGSDCSNCPVTNVYHSRKPQRAEQSHFDGKGNKLFVECFAAPIFDEKGSISGVLVLLVDVTEQKNTEKKLQQLKVMLETSASAKEAALAKSEGKFAVAFDASPDAININRIEDGLYIEVNKGFNQLTGYTQEDVIGKTSHEIDIWYDPADRQRLVKRLNKYGYCENLEARFRRKDGTVTTALMSARIISVNDEPHIISITRDIGKLRKMERKIAAQQRLFETMFNAIEDGIVITNTQREIILANDGMEQTFGYTREELLGMTTEPLYADRQRYNESGKKIFNASATNSNVQYSQIYKHKKGREFPAATFAAKLRDRDGNWIGNLGIMRDITEQQKSEVERDKLIAAVQQSGEAIVITDLKGTIEFVNRAFETITGYSKDEVIGKKPSVLKSGRHDESFYQDLWNTITSGKTFKNRIINRRKDGSEYTEEVTISPITSAEGEIVNYIAVKRDITVQLTMEQQLRQAQKMEAVGRLTGGVAHDFNNMLGVILGYAELALDKIPQQDENYENLQKILEATERSSSIVRQLLAFSRQQTIAPKKLDLNSTVAGMLKMLHRLIGEDIRLDWCPHSAPLPIKMDPSQIDQILANLCVNSKDAIVDHGTITIETATAYLDEFYCSEHIGFKPGEYVMLTISDDGFGIEKESMEHIFEPFFTTKDVGRGTGLGLSTVYGIVKQNQGFINIYSEPGQGTTVKVYFPICHDPDEPREEAAEEITTQSGNEHILIVEDDTAIRTMVETMLTKLGYTVISAQTPTKALQLVKEKNLIVDLLLTDVVMPDMNGKELSDRLQGFLPGIKCLYMSGYTSNVIANKGVLSENVHFIQKPFSKNVLGQKIREVLAD